MSQHPTCRFYASSTKQIQRLLLVVVLLGCRTKAVEVNKNKPASDPPAVEISSLPSDATPTTVVPLAQLGVTDVATQPPAVSWSVEEFNSRAGRQLDALKKIIQADQDVSVDKLQSLVTEDLQCTSLISANAEAVYDDSVLRVSRPKDNPSAKQSYRGKTGFADALEHLRALAAAASERRVAFKITSVEQEETSIHTTLEVHLVGVSESSAAEHVSHWDCTWADSNRHDLPRLKNISVRNEQTTVSSQPPWFQDVTSAVLGNEPSYRKQLSHGVDYWMDRLEQRFGINSSGWQGLAVADVNGDGLEDVYVCQPGGLPNRLFVQQADGTAVDASASAGVDYWDHSHAALFLDLDGDDDQDLVLATALGLIFLANDGDAHFSVKTAKLCPEAMPFTLAAADYDQDGDLDIYASCYSPRGKAIRTEFLARPVPYHDANNGGRNCLFRNEGNWQYKNVTRQVGLDSNNRRFSLAASWEDYDNDGDQDLYVANDYGRNNLYRNDDGKFTDVASVAGVEDISAGMSVSWADYNQDGWMDLYVSNMWSSAGKRITFQRQFQSDSDDQTRIQFQRHARGNSLFLNACDGSFRDVSVSADVTMGRWAWCSQFVDINNDSWEDLVVANGFITQEDQRDL